MKKLSVLMIAFGLTVSLSQAFWGDKKKEESSPPVQDNHKQLQNRGNISALGPNALLEDERNTVSVYQNSVHSVVNVTNIQLMKTWNFGTVEEIPAGMGSGYVWDKEGNIVTNFHVVQGGAAFLVTFHGDQKQYKAELRGVEPRKDIAVLKLVERPKELHPISVGSSRDLQAGQKVMAIGSPFGLDHSISQGIVSATGRVMEGVAGLKIYDMIQTDAAINRGNSGGPLLDSSGNLIGMNTQIISPSGGSSGLGFAVPVDTIARIVPQIIEHGEVIRPGLGINPLPEDAKRRFVGEKGVVIQTLDEDGAAFKAGMRGMTSDKYGRYKIGDIILAINGVEVNDIDELIHELDKFKVGDSVEIKYLREEKEVSTKLKLKKL